MGRNSKRRRDAKRQARPQVSRVTPGTSAKTAPTPGTLTQADVIALIEIATRYASVSQRMAVLKVDELNRISVAATSPELDPAAMVVDEVLNRIRLAWEHGWQPLHLVHGARRRTSASAARWVGRAVLAEADRVGAADRAPTAWLGQLTELASRSSAVARTEPLLQMRGASSVEAWSAALASLSFLQQIPPLEQLTPPPSRWGMAQPSRPSATYADPRRGRMLSKVRALLAKAESTDFTAEADAFTAKAQDLMTRYAIDEALVAADAGEPVDVLGLRVLIHHPYGLEKATLLDVISRVNRVRAVWNDFASTVTLLGAPTDVAQVEMLFTSTLVQATRAMTHVGEHSHSHDRSSSFRKAFLTAYATRLGQRLAEAAQQATDSYGTDLVPVLQRQTDAIDEEFERLFPHITVPRGRRQFDARGWDAGTRAADAAVLPAGEVGPAGSESR